MQLTPEAVIFGRKKIASGVFCGAFHSFITTKSDGVFAFGLNNFGQLGVGDTKDRIKPERITSVKNGDQIEKDVLSIIALDGGMHHSVALTEEGHVYTFGRSDSGQCGIDLGESTELSLLQPTRVVTLLDQDIVKVACGGNHTLAVTREGHAYGWGFGEMYQLGTGDEGIEMLPVLMKAPLVVLAVDGGAQFSVILF